jgi:hypothetical protein
MSVMAQADLPGGEIHGALNIEPFSPKSMLDAPGEEIPSAEGTYETVCEPFGPGMWTVRDDYGLCGLNFYAAALAGVRGTWLPAQQVTQGVLGSPGTSVGAVKAGQRGLFSILRIVETMEAAKPRGKELKGEARISVAAQRRRLRPSSEVYPDLDLERIQARVGELHETASASEAVSLVVGRSVQIVHQAE